MGACFSCKSSPEFKSIRVVHMDGYVQDFENPVSASQVMKTGKLPSRQQHLVFTAAQLLCTDSKPLKPDAQLQTGQLYFLLPYSILRPDVSPVDCISLVKRLTSIARSSRCAAAATTTTGVQDTKPSGTGSLRSQGIPFCNSPVRRSWKPDLDTIREKSFNRRSESELQEMDLRSLSTISSVDLR